jgi:hypothetical protein
MKQGAIHFISTHASNQEHPGLVTDGEKEIPMQRTTQIRTVIKANPFLAHSS